VNIYKSPDDIDSIVTPIMKTLCIPQNSYTRVKKILQDLKTEIENPDAYAEKKDGRGRKQLIQELAENTAEAERQRLAEEIIEEVQQENVEEGTTGEDLGNDMEGEEEE
jgi:hypothetical protein